MTNRTIAGVPHQRAGLRGGQSLPGLHPLLAGGEGGEAGGQEEAVHRLPARVLSIWVRKALSFNLNLHPSWLRSTSQPIIFAKSSPSRSFHFHSTSVVPPSPHTTLESCSIVLEKEGEFKYFQNSLAIGSNFCICCIEMKVKSRHIEWLHCPGKLPICSVVKGDCYTFYCQCNDQISQKKRLT